MFSEARVSPISVQSGRYICIPLTKGDFTCAMIGDFNKIELLMLANNVLKVGCVHCPEIHLRPATSQFSDVIARQWLSLFRLRL